MLSFSAARFPSFCRVVSFGVHLGMEAKEKPAVEPAVEQRRGRLSCVSARTYLLLNGESTETTIEK